MPYSHKRLTSQRQSPLQPHRTPRAQTQQQIDLYTVPNARKYAPITYKKPFDSELFLCGTFSSTSPAWLSGLA